MKTLLILAIFIFGASATYQQRLIHSLTSERQLLVDRLNQLESFNTSLTEKKQLDETEKNPLFLPEKSQPTKPTSNDVNSDIVIQLLEKTTKLERQLTSLKEYVESASQHQHIAEETLSSLSTIDDSPSIVESKAEDRQRFANREQELAERMLSEDFDSDWALVTEGNITEEVSRNNLLSQAESLQFDCRTSICKISLFYMPQDEESLLEFENELLAAIGRDLSNVSNFTKQGSMEQGYSIHLFATP